MSTLPLVMRAGSKGFGAVNAMLLPANARFEFALWLLIASGLTMALGRLAFWCGANAEPFLHSSIWKPREGQVVKEPEIRVILTTLPLAGNAEVTLIYRAVVPLFSEPENATSAPVHINRFFIDHERHGFFRIGLLPVAVADGVRFEIRAPRAALQALRDLPNWFGKRGRTKRFELRRAEFLFSGQLKSRLYTGLARLKDPNQLELSGGVTFERAGDPVAAVTCRPLVGRTQTGLVLLAASGHLIKWAL